MSCNNNIKICSQTNIPQVDNSEIECAESGFISTDCVLLKEAVTYLNLPENSKLTDLISTLIISLTDTRNRLMVAEEKIIELENLNP